MFGQKNSCLENMSQRLGDMRLQNDAVLFRFGQGCEIALEPSHFEATDREIGFVMEAALCIRLSSFLRTLHEIKMFSDPTWYTEDLKLLSSHGAMGWESLHFLFRYQGGSVNELLTPLGNALFQAWHLGDDRQRESAKSEGLEMEMETSLWRF